MKDSNESNVRYSPEEINRLLEKGEIEITEAFTQLDLRTLQFGKYFETPPTDLSYISFEGKTGWSAVGYLAITDSKIAELQAKNLPIILVKDYFSTELLEDCKQNAYHGIIVANSLDRDLVKFFKTENIDSEEQVDADDFCWQLAHVKVNFSYTYVPVLFGKFDNPAFKIDRESPVAEIVYSWGEQEYRLPEGQIVSLDADLGRLYPTKLNETISGENYELTRAAEEILKDSDINIEVSGDSTDPIMPINLAEYHIDRIGLIRTENGMRKALLLDYSQKENNAEYSWSQYWQDIQNDRSSLDWEIFNKQIDIKSLSPRQKLTRLVKENATGLIIPPPYRPYNLFHYYMGIESELLDFIEEEYPDLLDELDSRAGLGDVDFYHDLFVLNEFGHPLEDPDTKADYLELVKNSSDKLTLKELLLYHVREYKTKKFPMSVRLVDLRSIKDFLPPDLQQELKSGFEHDIESDIFKLKLSLYEIQIRAIVQSQMLYSGDAYNEPNYSISEFSTPIEILVPAISNPIELEEIYNRMPLP